MANKQSLLIVDDDKDIREMLRLAMMASGWNVRTASDGVEALQVIEQHHPEAMLLDLMMPRMTGYQVLDTLRGEGRLDKFPVIILTAKDIDPEERNKLDGARAVLQKGSIDLFLLANRICNALSDPVAVF
jgi:CheY-like chemotaxis protein